MNFYKLEKQLLKSLNIKDNAEAYVLEKDGTVLGYGIIDRGHINNMEIFIKEEYRSNGYGKLLFKKMIDELKKQGYKEIKFTFLRSNYRIKNIIAYYGGLQLHTNEKEEVYVLPLK